MRTPFLALLVVLALFATGCASRHAPAAQRRVTYTAAPATGDASYYASRFQGRPTASGERFDNNQLTAAHRTLPFGTLVRVRSLVNGSTVDVRINDRGPFLKRRVIDLSKAAAKALGLLASGTGTKAVELFVVEQPGGAVFR